MAPFLPWNFINDEQKSVAGSFKGRIKLICWLVDGVNTYNWHAQVFKAAYCSPYHAEKEGEVLGLRQNFVDAVYSYKPEMLRKPKFHLLLHLAECMTEFGPNASFNTEVNNNWQHLK